MTKPSAARTHKLPVRVVPAAHRPPTPPVPHAHPPSASRPLSRRWSHAQRVHIASGTVVAVFVVIVVVWALTVGRRLLT